MAGSCVVYGTLLDCWEMMDACMIDACCPDREWISGARWRERERMWRTGWMRRSGEKIGWGRGPKPLRLHGASTDDRLKSG